MTKVSIEVWKDGDDIMCSHEISNINGDARTPLLLCSLKTMKGTTKRKLNNSLWVIHNTSILLMAKQEAKNPQLQALHYQDEVKDIIIVSQETEINLVQSVPAS